MMSDSPTEPDHASARPTVDALRSGRRPEPRERVYQALIVSISNLSVARTLVH